MFLKRENKVDALKEKGRGGFCMEEVGITEIGGCASRMGEK